MSTNYRKKKEIAILKIQGLNHKKIIFLFSIQGTCIGIFGTLFGIFFGYLITKNINYLTSLFNLFECGNDIILPIHISVKQIIIISITTISLSFLATLYPAKIATDIHPNEVLRHE